MLRIILPIILAVVFAAGTWYIKSNGPEARKRPAAPAPLIEVSTTVIKAQSLRLVLSSYGKIRPRTQTLLSAEVSGKVVSINPAFSNGAFFEKGDILLQLDKRDYQSAINTAKASLTQAEQDLALEKAQVKQAQADWKRLGNKSPAPTLVSRKPQEISAKAKVSAAHAAYNTAILNFQRTTITAPFTGRVLSKSVSVGQLVSANSQVAEIYATDYIEVRLPIQNSDLPFIDLPETFNGEAQADITTLPKATFESDLIEPQRWQGRIVQTEGALDSASQQLFVIGKITNPYSDKNSDKHPLKIGQYVRSSIQGKVIDNAIAINIKHVYQGEYVYLVRDGVLKKQPVNIRWQNDKLALIDQGLTDGDQLVTTTLGQVPSGTRVKIMTSKPISPEPTQSESSQAVPTNTMRQSQKVTRSSQAYLNLDLNPDSNRDTDSPVYAQITPEKQNHPVLSAVKTTLFYM